MCAKYPERPWRVAQSMPQAEDLAHGLGLPAWLGQVLFSRGLNDLASAKGFLHTPLRELPPPSGLRGLNKAVELLAPAISQGLVIGVAGDYDADGVTATALLVEFLQQAGARVVWQLPHRVADGYGFSPAVARRLADAGAEIAVTVDCGTSDHEGVAAAQELGMQVVVTDHHQVPPGPLVAATAVINPQRDDCGFCDHLAGVGVAFYLAAGLRAALRAEGWFKSRPEPNLRDSLDLVAIGTCADVVPLLDHNRVLVREGLKVLNEGRRPGLKALVEAARQRPPLDARDVSFGLAPRLNAAGRMDHADPALELLLTRDPARARALAGELDQINRQRQRLEQGIFSQALSMVDGSPELGQAACLVLAAQGWHRGVLGIVASRLAERFNRPALLLSVENGKAVGSGRSVEGFHLQKALASLAHLLTHYGGHSQAVGCTLPTAAVAELGRGLNELAAGALPEPGRPKPLHLDAVAEVGDLGSAALSALEKLAPFGQGNPEPILACLGARVESVGLVGENHLKLKLAQEGDWAPAIGFNMAEFAPLAGDTVDVAFIPRASSYGGRHLEMVLEDVRPASMRGDHTQTE
jgi:single-stranded-DNA-specific exonuclease